MDGDQSSPMADLSQFVVVADAPSDKVAPAADSTALIIGIVAGVLLLCVVIAIVAWVLHKKRGDEASSPMDSDQEMPIDSPQASAQYDQVPTMSSGYEMVRQSQMKDSAIH